MNNTKQETIMQLNNFLDAVLYDAGDDFGHVFCVQNRPIGGNVGWPPITEGDVLRRVNSGRSGEYSAYMSTMIANKTVDGFRNRRKDFYALSMIVLDDIGGKVSPNSLKPTYIIESSEGNYQWGYVFETPVTDLDLASRLVATIYGEDGLTDSGGAMVNKYVRLPCGINNKLRDGVVDDFAVKLVELNDIYYTPESLIEGFGVELVDSIKKRTSRPETPVNSTGMPVRDPVLAWLESRGLVDSSGSDGWLHIKCPWGHSHTTGNDLAGYSPLGEGNMTDYRAFNCMHEHCSERKTSDFLQWVNENGGGEHYVYDPVAGLISKWAFIANSNECVDTTMKCGSTNHILSINSFRNLIRGQMMIGKRMHYVSELWLESDDCVKTLGRRYEPQREPIIIEDERKYYNTYRAPSWGHAKGEPVEFLEHIYHIIPNADEAETFIDWLAYKLQNPRTRSYAVLMVAEAKLNILGGESEETFGIGRSTLGDIITAVWQEGVKRVDLSDISGSGDSQAAFNEWADSTQLCICEETKEGASGWREDNKAYERIKNIVDTRPIPNVRIKPKYGKIFNATVYTNFLMFSNHSDAIQIPEGDRRFYCIANNTQRRAFEDYARLHEIKEDRGALAQIYQWLMLRDVSSFDPTMPEMTATKETMIANSKSGLDEAFEECIADIKENIVTRAVLVEMMETKIPLGDPDRKNITRMVNAKWKKMHGFLGDSALNIGGKNYRVKIIRDVEAMLELKRSRKFDELRANTRVKMLEQF